jgi:hypothetical protein
LTAAPTLFVFDLETPMVINVVIAVVLVSVLANAIAFSYRFALADAMNMYPRSKKRAGDEQIDSESTPENEQ